MGYHICLYSGVTAGTGQSQYIAYYTLIKKKKGEFFEKKSKFIHEPEIPAAQTGTAGYIREVVIASGSLQGFRTV